MPQTFRSLEIEQPDYLLSKEQALDDNLTVDEETSSGLLKVNYRFISDALI